jgi:hypothetical protein
LKLSLIPAPRIYFSSLFLQAYERKSIEQHLQTADTDPMSRQPLLNSSLTPVFVLKSRALEYRETTCRLCIDRACSVSPAPRPPVEYLRRAVELCSDAGFLPKGLSAEVVDYVNSHLSNVYDRLVLDMFARGLFENGYRDRAAAVYFHLLVTEEDKAEQATLLKKCLACWSSEIHSSTFTVATSAVDSHVFEKLVQMIDTKESHFSWIIEVSSEAGLGNAFVAKLCQHILFPQLSSSASSSSGLCDSSLPGGGRGVARSKRKGNLPWETEKEVLLKYCFVLTSSLKEEQAEMGSKMKRLEEKVFRGGGGSGKQGKRGNFIRLWMNSHRSTKSDNTRSDHEENESDSGDGDGHPLNNALKVVKKAVQHPIVMAACGAVAVFGDPHHPLVRSTLLVPFLASMNTDSTGGGGGGGRFSSSSLVEMPESPSVEEVEVLDQTTSISSSNSNEESRSKENE